MSGLYTARQNHANPEPLGTQLRNLRDKAGVPLWEAAAAAKMDSTLLSKIENGRRLPKPKKLAALAKFYKVPVAPLEQRRIAEDLIRQYGDNPEFMAATAIIREDAGEYPVKKLSAVVSKSAKPVNKRRNSK